MCLLRFAPLEKQEKTKKYKRKYRSLELETSIRLHTYFEDRTDFFNFPNNFCFNFERSDPLKKRCRHADIYVLVASLKIKTKIIRKII